MRCEHLLLQRCATRQGNGRGFRSTNHASAVPFAIPVNQKMVRNGCLGAPLALHSCGLVGGVHQERSCAEQAVRTQQRGWQLVQHEEAQ
jgi:hypothetical protein